MPESKMMEAFIQQTYGSVEKMKEAMTKADEQMAKEKELQKEFERKAMMEMAMSKNVSDYMDIPSNLKAGELDQKTEAHPNFKGYDHSLEMDRKVALRTKYLEEKYKDSKESIPDPVNDFKFTAIETPMGTTVDHGLQTGSIEDMFNNIFDDE